MQHGFLGSLSKSEDRLELPYKLKSVSDLYLYNSDAKNYFLSNVISKDVSSLAPRIHFFTPSLNISSSDDALGYFFRILFVGSPLCENFHMNLFSKINNESFLCYYKPHPLNPCSNTVYNLSWKVIEDKGFFPDVDLVICYPSTLELEYSSLGIRTLCHLVDASDKDINHYVSLINEIAQDKKGDEIEG
jgi:hypothetical protein